MHRIVVQCEVTGCIRAPKWALNAGATSRVIRACDNHLGRIARMLLRLSGAPETIEIQEI